MVYLLLIWSGVAYAAEDSFAMGLASLSKDTMLGVLALSGVGGILGTLVRLNADNVAAPKNLSVAIAKDTLGSVVAGMIAFFTTSWGQFVPFFPQAVIITLAGYGGSKFVEMMFNDGAVPWVKQAAQRLFNITPKDTK